MSEFRVEVVRVGPVSKHPNADSLSVTMVHGGYPCIFRNGDFKEGDLATYISRDAMVPLSHPYFKFLDKGKGNAFHRVKAVRLRGLYSEGLLVPVVPGGPYEPGDSMVQQLGVQKYEMPDDRADRSGLKTKRRRGFDRMEWLNVGSAFALICLSWVVFVPALALVFSLLIMGIAHMNISQHREANKSPVYPTYDLEGLRKFSGVFEEGEDVYVSEKLHGMNCSYYHNGKRLHVKSRTVARHDKNDTFWRVAKKYKLEDKLKDFPGLVLFGEIYGKGIQDLEYGKSEPEFAAFDVAWLKNGKLEFLGVRDFLALCRLIDVPTTPALYVGPYCQEIRELAEGPSCIEGSNHLREGVVIRSMVEENHLRCGRKVLKLVGEGYLTR